MDAPKDKGLAPPTSPDKPLVPTEPGPFAGMPKVKVKAKELIFGHSDGRGSVVYAEADVFHCTHGEAASLVKDGNATLAAEADALKGGNVLDVDPIEKDIQAGNLEKLAAEGALKAPPGAEDVPAAKAGKGAALEGGVAPIGEPIPGSKNDPRGR